MGSAHDIMQTFASKDLHAQFPDYDGWNWKILPTPNSGNPVYRVSRYYHGQQQEAILAVSLEPRPSAGSIAALTSIITDSWKMTSRYLLVPQGTDVSCIPEGIGILTMTSFGFINDKLVWLIRKKSAIRYPVEECAVT